MEPTKRRRRIAIWSRVLSVALVLAAVLVPALTMLAVAVMSPDQLAAAAHLGPGRIAQPSVGAHAAIVAIAGLPALVFSCGVAALLPALTALRRGDFFSETAFRALRRCSGALVIATLLRIAATPLSGLVLSLGEAEGSLSISVGFDTVQSLILAGAVWLLAWIFAEGAAVAAENRQFV